MDDLQRQRTLERAGWTFWRCWGSSFLRDPAGCMRDLRAVLKKLDIEPIGALDADLSDIVEYRELGTDDGESPYLMEEEQAPQTPFEDLAPKIPPPPKPKAAATALQPLLQTEADLPLWNNATAGPAVIGLGDSVRYILTLKRGVQVLADALLVW